MPSPEPASKKKPFQTPRLVEYGDIRQITRAVDTGNGEDNAKGNHKKTQ